PGGASRGRPRSGGCVSSCHGGRLGGAACAGHRACPPQGRRAPARRRDRALDSSGEGVGWVERNPSFSPSMFAMVRQFRFPSAHPTISPLLRVIGSEMPPDIAPHSGFRLPLLKRDELDEAGQATYDRAARGGNVAGLRGPAGVALYSRGAQAHLRAIIDYLRTDADIPARVREVALLATERELDSQFQWLLHERE